MARLYRELFEESALEVEDVRPVAALLREAAAYGRALAEVAASSGPSAGPGEGRAEEEAGGGPGPASRG